MAMAEGIQMADIENPADDPAASAAGDLAQPQSSGRWHNFLAWLRSNPDNNNGGGPDGVVAAAAEPEQRSRRAFICFAAFLFLAMLFISYTLFSLSDNDQGRNTAKTKAGRKLQVAGQVFGSFFLITDVYWVSLSSVSFGRLLKGILRGRGR